MSTPVRKSTGKRSRSSVGSERRVVRGSKRASQSDLGDEVSNSQPGEDVSPEQTAADIKQARLKKRSMLKKAEGMLSTAELNITGNETLEPSDAMAEVHRLDKVDTRFAAGADEEIEGEEFQQIGIDSMPDQLPAAQVTMSVQMRIDDAQRRFLGHDRNALTCIASYEHFVFYADKGGSVCRLNEKDGTRIMLDPTPGRGVRVLSLAVSNTTERKQQRGFERSTLQTTATSHLAAGTDGGYIRIWNTLTLEHIGDFRIHQAAVTGVAFQLHTSTLYSIATDGILRVWSCENMARVDKFYGHRGSVTCVSSLGKDRCVTGGEDRTVRLWKIDKATQVQLHEHSRPVECLGVLDENTVVAGCADGSLQLYDPSVSGPIWSQKYAHGYATIGDGTGLEAYVPALSTSSQPKYDATTRKTEDNEEEHTPFLGNAIASLAVYRSGDLIATGSFDDFVRIWRFTGSGKERRLEPEAALQLPGFVNGITISELGVMYCAAAKEPRLGRWNVRAAALNGIFCAPLTLKATKLLAAMAQGKVLDDVKQDDEDARPATKKRRLEPKADGEVASSLKRTLLSKLKPTGASNGATTATAKKPTGKKGTAPRGKIAKRK